jgi:hypothetical protein
MKLANERTDCTCVMHRHFGEHDRDAIHPRIGRPPRAAELSQRIAACILGNDRGNAGLTESESDVLGRAIPVERAGPLGDSGVELLDGEPADGGLQFPDPMAEAARYGQQAGQRSAELECAAQRFRWWGRVVDRITIALGIWRRSDSQSTKQNGPLVALQE